MPSCDGPPFALIFAISDGDGTGAGRGGPIAGAGNETASPCIARSMKSSARLKHARRPGDVRSSSSNCAFQPRYLHNEEVRTLFYETINLPGCDVVIVSGRRCQPLT